MGRCDRIPVERELVQLQQFEGAAVGVGEQREPAAPLLVARLRRQRLHGEAARERARRTCHRVFVPNVHVI